MTRLRIVPLCVLIAGIVACGALAPEPDDFGRKALADPRMRSDDTLLWYRQPAKRWTEALPLGNGRLGAMVFGGVDKERIQLNEESLWAGEPADAYPPDFRARFAEYRKLVLAGELERASAFGVKHLTARPTSFRSYQPLADLWLESVAQAGAAEDKAAKGATPARAAARTNVRAGGAPREYRRQLDLHTGIATTTWLRGNQRLAREALISAVDDVVAVRVRGDRPGAVSLRVRLTRARDAKVRAVGSTVLALDGQIIDRPPPEGHEDNPGGSGPTGPHMRFAARLALRSVGGQQRAEGDSLVVTGADEVVLLLTAATDYSLQAMNFDRRIDPAARAEAILNAASAKSWKQLRRAHVAEHRAIFDRVALDLGGADRRALPTDERLRAVKKGAADPGLAALLFQHGRYLLMSSSRRPGRLPANLQGIWNQRMWAPWEADYHLNINLQMNYWPANVCNLSETMAPLADWLSGLAKRGERSARRLFDADGWVAYHATNPFGRTTPSGSTLSSQYNNGLLDPFAGAWMSMSLWRHYLFTRDEDFLRKRAWPVLRGAAEFVLDYMVEMPDGTLAVVPSTSPENAYIHPRTGKPARLTVSSAYQVTIARVLWKAARAAAQRIGQQQGFVSRIDKALARLPALEIGANGTIQEWNEDYAEREPGHRHISHLVGLHPFAEIGADTPELLAAARKTMQRRMAHGGGHTGWSRAWLINMFARLGDGESAHASMRKLLQKSTLLNLFGTHPPFQIDGNFGGTAGIAEMLLQSHDGTIHLLPALPSTWRNGEVRGLKARGGFVIDQRWRDGRLVHAAVHSTLGGTCRIRIGSSIREIETVPGKTYDALGVEPLSSLEPAGRRAEK